MHCRGYLGDIMSKRWLEKEKIFVKENYKIMDYKDIAKILGRTCNSIYKYVSRNLEALSKMEIGKRGYKNSSISSRNMKKENNPYWKGNISKNHYHYKKLQKERYPERIRAREKVFYAIKSGKLIKKPCEECGDQNSHAHHENYLNPLDVIWLCPLHHRQRHCS